MSEQFRLHQVPGYGGHIQSDKRLARPGAVAVQSARHQLLASPGFPVDEDGDVAVREPSDGAEDLLHRRRLANNLGLWQLLGARRCPPLFFGLRQGPFGDRDDFVEVKGLWQVLKSAPLIRLYRTVQVGVGGGDDDGQLRVVLGDFRQQLEPVGTRHSDIADNDVRLLFAHTLEKLISVIKTLVAYASLVKGSLQNPANRTVVVHYPDFRLSMHDLVPMAGRL